MTALTAPLTTAAEMMRWIELIVSRGIRRPGTAVGTWVEEWAACQFTGLGLHTRLEPVEMLCWQSGPAWLDVGVPGGSGTARISGFQLPYTAAVDELTAPLRSSDSDDVADSLAVTRHTLDILPMSALLPLASDAVDLSGELAADSQLLPLSREALKVVEPAMARGAAGFVGMLANYPWDCDSYYVPYDAVLRSIPGIWLRRSAAPLLDAVLSGGEAVATLHTEGHPFRHGGHNVVGTLPGRGASWVVIASHHDAPWASAVEDASGVALVLAQARYWAQVPEEERPHNLCFLLTAGHMCHAAGTAAFVREHRDLLSRTVLEVHLEHVALRPQPETGDVRPSSTPEIRWWFTTRAPTLERVVGEALRAEGLDRSIVLPPDRFFADAPPTDGAEFHRQGVPVVHFLSAPSYLFDPGDTVSMVDRDALEPIGRAVCRIVSATGAWTSATLREEASRMPPTWQEPSW